MTKILFIVKMRNKFNRKNTSNHVFSLCESFKVKKKPSAEMNKTMELKKIAILPSGCINLTWHTVNLTVSCVIRKQRPKGN